LQQWWHATHAGIIVVVKVLVMLVAAAAAAVNMCWHAGAGAGGSSRPRKVVSYPLKGAPKSIKYMLSSVVMPQKQGTHWDVSTVHSYNHVVVRMASGMHCTLEQC
jgi:hypothetical protein